MKYFAVIIFGFILGYSVYPLLNPPLKEVIVKNVSGTGKTQSKVSLGSVRNMESVNSARPVNVKVDIQPETTVEVPEQEKVVQKNVPSKKLSLPEKILADKIDFKTYLGFAGFPNLNLQDSRILKLTGSFKGKLRMIKPSRTGILENITFEINQDPEKVMTKFEVIDIYDNTSLNIYQLTENSFKSVPGDENLLMLRSPDGFIVFDMKSFPSIKGKLFSLNKLKGQFNLEKSKKKPREHQSN